MEVLESVLLVRRLPPHFRNVGKRPTKAPKLFLRDTGLLHHLLNMGSAEQLDAHPVRGASLEGSVVEGIVRCERVARPALAGLLLAHSGRRRDRPSARPRRCARRHRNQCGPRRRAARRAFAARGAGGCAGAARLDRRSGAGRGTAGARNRADRVRRGSCRDALIMPTSCAS